MGQEEFEELIGIPKHAIGQFTIQYKKSGKYSAHHKFGYLDEVLVLFVYLRHYPVNILLAAIFQTWKSHVDRVHKTMLDWFYDTVKHELTFNSLNYRRQQSHTLFYTVYTFGVDGSEQGINANTKHDRVNINCYSSKKQRHTLNILVVVGLNGKVFWVSPAHYGIHNDNYIFAATKDGWLPRLERWEHGVGDKGFRACDRISTPPSRSSPLFPFFCKLRIVVENAIADIKDWKCCKDNIRESLKDMQVVLAKHHKRWTVVSVLKNRYNSRGNVQKK